MVVGTIPGAILGKLFDKQIEEHLRLPGIIGVSMVGHRAHHVVGGLPRLA